MTQIDRTKPPVKPGLPKFSFPDFSVEHLPNGIKVLLVEDASQPLASVNVLLKRGAAHEPVPGLAQFAARMMTRGTAKRSALEISGEMDTLGVSFQAGSQWDFTNLAVIGLADHLGKALEVAADCLLNSILPEEEIERVRLQSIADLRQELVDADYLVSLAFSTELFDSHPYGHPRRGTESSLNKITRGECGDWYSSLLTESQVVIIAAGNFTRSEIMSLLEANFSGWKVARRESEENFPVRKIDRYRVVAINKPEAAQTVLQVGQFAPRHEDKDYTAFRVLNTIYGGYFLSRINALLREKHGYTYGAHSYLDTRKYSSLFLVHTSVGEEFTVPSVRGIIAELERLRTEKTSEEELERAVQYMAGSFVRGIETPQQVAGFLQNIELYNLPGNFYDEFFRTLASMTPERLFEVQQRWLTPEHLVISAAGNTEYLRQHLREFGEVRVIATE